REATIERHESPARLEGGVGQSQQVQRLSVIQVMQHAIGQGQIVRPRGVYSRGSDFHATKGSSASESRPGCRNVLRADIDPVVIDIWQILKDIARPAADVQNPISGLRTDEVGNVSFMKVSRDHAGEKSIGARDGESRAQTTTFSHDVPLPCPAR